MDFSKLNFGVDGDSITASQQGSSGRITYIKSWEWLPITMLP